MKKISGVCILALGVLALSISSANAFCLTLDGFCDRIEVFAGTAGMTYGHWDYLCTDDFSSKAVMGNLANNRPIVGDLNDEQGITYKHIFHMGAGLWRMYGYDNVNPPFPVHIDLPFSASLGNCPPPPIRAGGEAAAIN